MLKLPPFGKVLFDLEQQGLFPKNSVYIFIGIGSFKKATEFQRCRAGTLCLPPFLCPSEYRWPVRGCDIMIFETSSCNEEYLNDLAFYLFQFGAKAVRAFLTTEKFVTYAK